MNSTRKLTISGVVMAMYIAVMFVTQGFSFYAIQFRVATTLYGISYIFPFLIVPIGIANALSNLLMGGLGVLDVIGGFIAGVVISTLAYFVRRFKLPRLLIIPIIALGNGLIVPIWLSYLLGIPYLALVVSVTLGQLPSGIAAYFLITVLDEHMKKTGGYEYEKESKDDSDRP